MKENKRQESLLKPIVNLDSDPNDCFGNEWEPSDNNCAVCADLDICGIVFHSKVVKHKIDKFEEQFKNKILDKVTFDKVDWNKIRNLIGIYQKKKTPLKIDELIEIIQKVSNTDDKELIIQYIKMNLNTEHLFIKNDLIYSI